MLRFVFVALLALWGVPEYEGDFSAPLADRITGISLVAPKDKVDDSWTTSVRQMNAEWVAILPYAWTPQGKTAVSLKEAQAWWGERTEGLIACIQHAHTNGLKVMLKPMVWVPGDWPGGISFDTEAEWQAWEAEYCKFIFNLCDIAKKEGVELFCIGTEFKTSSEIREQFWRKLAKEVRAKAGCPVTYAANWDEFLKVKFWDELDYIGIDAYFPLSASKTPSLKELTRVWQITAPGIKRFAARFGKKVLFTEFGYRSVNFCAWKQWELERVPMHKQVNLKAQENAYRAFFENIWGESWFGGVFLWQWYAKDAAAGGLEDSDYTPQNKPVEELISGYFSQ